MGTFVFRWPYRADHVYVTGTFDDWGKTERLEKVGDYFEKEVKLSSADHKIMYKFVVNDEWIVDDQAPKEDDGHYNVNNVLLPDQIKRTGHRVVATSRARPGSISADHPREAPTVSAGGDGAPLLTNEQSEANLARWIPHIVPDPRRPVTRTLSKPDELPQLDGAAASKPEATEQSSHSGRDAGIVAGVAAGIAGSPVAAHEFDKAGGLRENITGGTDSTEPARSDGLGIGATTSGVPGPEYKASQALRENIESQPAIAAVEHDIPGAFPGTPANEPETYQADPLPATGHQDTQSSVTTSKEDYEKLGALGTAGMLGAGAVGSGVAHSSPGGAGMIPDEVNVQPLPASGHKDLSSSVTTSKDDYEKLGSLGTADTAGAGTIPDEVNVQPLPASGHKDLSSSVTTSKDDYEKLGSLGTADTAGAAGVAASAPAGAGTIPHEVSVQPLPATGHDDIQSSVTTSKEDYEKTGGEGTGVGEYRVNPIPATGHKDTQSSVTTSKEDYGKLGALGLAAAATTGAGAYVASLFSKPTAEDKNIIPESSLPMNPGKTDMFDAGPVINSSGPGTTTSDLASKVPLEPKREAQVIEPGAPVIGRENPYMNPLGPGTTTADLASKVPLEPTRDAQVVGGPEAPEPSKHASATPFVSSSGPGTTTANLASEVPLEPKRNAQVVDPSAPEAPVTSKEASASPFVSSVGAGATTAALASQVPLEKDLAPGIKEEKSAVEKELLNKVPESHATGASASAAKAQSSYYGLATSVPEPVEESFAKAHASPEAATEPSVVAEKSLMEQELQSKVPVVDTAGEPAPTFSAVSVPVAPKSATEAGTAATTPPSAAATVDALTDGITANKTVPDTDTSTATTAPSAGDLAAGAVAGSAAAAGAAALAVRHDNKEIEPARIADSQKPDITTEAAPATKVPGTSPAAAAALSHGTEDPTKIKDVVSPRSAGALGQASPHPGVAPAAGAAISDGTEDATVADEPTAPKLKAPVETSEATATENAPSRHEGIVPGASPTAAVPLVHGTKDPTLIEEPAVQRMTQNEAGAATHAHGTTVYDAITMPASTTSGAAATGTSTAVETPVATETSKVAEAPAAESSKATETPAAGQKKDSVASSDIGPKDTSKTPAAAPATPKKAVAGPAAPGTTSAASTPAKSTTSASTPTGEQKKKKRHRLSAIIKKIFD